MRQRVYSLVGRNIPYVSVGVGELDQEETMANLQSRKIEELKGGFKGELLLPSDGAYESARKIWNAMIDKRGIGWARDFFNASAPFASGGVYVNFLTADEGDRVRSAYGPNYDRLAQVKRKYDPDNLFRMNQNIEPA
jgi:berberine-like enzyme